MGDAGPFHADRQPPHVIIVGFGLAGRYVAELLECHGVPHCVIELNPLTVERCAGNGTRLILGDSRNPEILLQADIRRARMLALTIPHEEAVLETIEAARRLCPEIPILARCAFTSAGLRAQQLGADHVIVAEQLVAREFYRVVQNQLCPSSAHPPTPSS